MKRSNFVKGKHERKKIILTNKSKPKNKSSQNLRDEYIGDVLLANMGSVNTISRGSFGGGGCGGIRSSGGCGGSRTGC